MDVGEGAWVAGHELTAMLARLQRHGATAQRHWLRLHGVRVDQLGTDHVELSRMTHLVGEQLLAVVREEVHGPDDLRRFLHPEPVQLTPPDVLGFADARPGPPATTWPRQGGETLYAYSRDRQLIGWLYAEVEDDGTVSLHGAYVDPQFRGHAIARYLLLLAQAHFGTWRTLVPETSDPAEAEALIRIGKEHGLRVADRAGRENRFHECRRLGSRELWPTYLG